MNQKCRLYKIFLWFCEGLFPVTVLLSILGFMGFFGLPERWTVFVPRGFHLLVLPLLDTPILHYLIIPYAYIITRIEIFVYSQLRIYNPLPADIEHIRWAGIFFVADIMISLIFLLIRYPVPPPLGRISCVESIIGSLLRLGKCAILSKYRVNFLGNRMNLIERNSIDDLRELY